MICLMKYVPRGTSTWYIALLPNCILGLFLVANEQKTTSRGDAEPYVYLHILPAKTKVHT